MGGSMGVESNPGAGSRFWVELPLSKMSAAPEKPRLDQPTVSLENVRVLLAEDNEINVEVAQRQIELLGCVVEVAPNGLHVLKMLDSNSYDLILMDVQMPEMDGLEATRVIREREGGRGRRIPIIALTATAFAEDKKACEDAGMDAFLSKPFKREDLERLLKQWAIVGPVST
jgi:CheY-like chemotaxis protein